MNKKHIHTHLVNTDFKILDEQGFIKLYKNRSKHDLLSIEERWKKVSKGFDFVLYNYVEETKSHNYFSIPFVQEEMRRRTAHE